MGAVKVRLDSLQSIVYKLLFQPYYCLCNLLSVDYKLVRCCLSRVLVGGGNYFFRSAMGLQA